jgi:uncharacterized membrane protein
VLELLKKGENTMFDKMIRITVTSMFLGLLLIFAGVSEVKAQSTGEKKEVIKETVVRESAGPFSRETRTTTNETTKEVVKETKTCIGGDIGKGISIGGDSCTIERTTSKKPDNN